MFVYKAIEQFNSLYFSTYDHSQKTIQAYNGDLKQFKKYLGKNIKILSITPEIIEGWALTLKEKDYAPASIQRKMTTLKVFFNYWIRKKQISSSPLWQLKICFGKSRTLPKTLSKNEIYLILKKANMNLMGVDVEYINGINSEFLSLRNLTIVELMFSTGLRVGELVSLNLSDFHADDRYIIIKGKGKRERLAFLTEEHSYSIVVQYTNKLKELLPNNTAFFINILKSRLSTQGVANTISKLAQNADVKKHITPHMLRHTVATLLLRNGADLRVVQEFLGHASIATTQIYTHITKEHLIDQLKSYHPSLSIKRLE